jgi:hypothetical protein
MPQRTIKEDSPEATELEGLLTWLIQETQIGAGLNKI